MIKQNGSEVRSHMSSLMLARMGFNHGDTKDNFVDVLIPLRAQAELIAMVNKQGCQLGGLFFNKKSTVACNICKRVSL